MRKQLIFLIGFTVLGLITVALVNIVRSQEPNPQETRSDDAEAIRRGGLREAARIRGHYVGTMKASHFLKYDLESLAAHSGNIIIGSPIDSTAHLSADGQLIMTWYRMKILQPMKGKLLSGETVSVSLPGGKLIFEDGTSAEIKTPDLEGMQNDQKYVLFLSPKLAVDGTFTLTGGSQGLFELDNKTRRIKPNGHPFDPVRKLKDQDADTFLGEIKATVKKYPEATTCCQ
jgi:hypothetical protein